MKIRSQIGMVLNLDKCIGCHTCSVTCKNVWSSREGVEYAWFNNVESKPGVGYPSNWEDQQHWKGGWEVNETKKLSPKLGGKKNILTKLFYNSVLPTIDDYYEPYSFDYNALQTDQVKAQQPIARPYSRITGDLIKNINNGPNWDDVLGGEFSKRAEDYNFNGLEKEQYGIFERTFMMYLPRLCEHCLNPSCVATCPSGAIYKREEDGIVLIDQDKCRGWRICVSGCPYKKIYFNWKSGKSEKCVFCYPRIESAEPTVCAETCVGRIRYLGVLLYDADKIKEVATSDLKDIYRKQLDIFLDPNDPNVISESEKQGVSSHILSAAQNSPVYKLVVKWQLAFPLHPEYRTLPMVWYVPPLSPVKSIIQKNNLSNYDVLPDVDELRIPIQYLANLLSAGDESVIVNALEKMLAMRVFKRDEIMNNICNVNILNKVALTEMQMNEMYRYLAIANYEDRFVLPGNQSELIADPDISSNACGFSFGDGCHGSNTKINLFGGKRIDAIDITFKEKRRS